ncbi:NAD(P)H-dependent oxidoreductase [Candidatus Wolfebacteria bacterium]|nr:NAD(P)H-dependent oxidoreductase [Candidatus Wolfebacteria bacterium]
MKILAISGSLRHDSYNRKALQIAKRMAQDLGADVTEADLKELNLPLYDGDIEAQGFPESVVKLRDVVTTADILLVASPEYNYSIPAGLKNALDWLSRQSNVLDGKVAIIFGASSGPFGTVRMQIDLRKVLADLNVFVLPQPQVHIPFAQNAFNDDGSLKDEKLHKRLKFLIEKSLRFAEKIKNL